MQVSTLRRKSLEAKLGQKKEVERTVSEELFTTLYWALKEAGKYGRVGIPLENADFAPKMAIYS
jgi:hypothetical protein